VIKSLGKGLDGLPGLSGSTILGDGTVALILDVPALLRQAVASTLS
jgi:two-component system, chemotaxis family, sensor kinase CheA